MSSNFKDTRRGFFKATAAVGVGYWVAGRASAEDAAPAAAPAEESETARRGRGSRYHAATRVSDGRLLPRTPGRRNDRSAQGQGDRVSYRRDRGRAGRVRPDRHRDRPEAGDSPEGLGKDRHSGVEHRDLGDPLAHGARLHEGAVPEAGRHASGSRRERNISRS